MELRKYADSHTHQIPANYHKNSLKNN